MVSMPHLLKLSLTVILLGGMAAGAQYGDAYHAPNQMELNRQAAARQQAASDQHFRNIAPKSSGSANSYGSPAAVPYGSYKKTAAEIAEERAEAEAERKLRAKLAAEAEASEARYRAQRLEKLKQNVATRAAFLEEELARDDERQLSELDKLDELYDNYWLRGASNVARIDRSDAVLAIHAFVRGKQAAPYDTLLDWSRRARTFPFANDAILKAMQRRFPERSLQTEKEELFAKPISSERSDPISTWGPTMASCIPSAGSRIRGCPLHTSVRSSSASSS